MRFSFDRFELDLDRRALLEDGKPLHLAPKAFTLLELLIAAAPRALSKEELSEALWPDTFVEAGNLSTLVTDLRAALGDRRSEPKYVRTVHGFGYSFCATVTRSEGPKRLGTLLFNGTEIPLYEGANVLGRDPSASVMIDHETVSRRHATLTLQATEAILEDLSSKNGTFLAGERLQDRAVLHDGAEFILGDARVTFRKVRSVGTTVTVHR